jgi:hypothetical protein
MNRAAAVLAWVTGLGFGVPGVYGLWYFAEHDTVWTFLGFPTYGDGPFEDAGIGTSVPLLGGFVLVCAAELVLGVLLWSGHRHAWWLSLVLLPAELFYWLGFALPFGLIFGLTRTALVLTARARPKVAQS